MEGEIIYPGEQDRCRDQAEILQTVINNHPSLKPHLDEARKLLIHLAFKGMR